MTSAANVRVLTPVQDEATAALSGELVAIAERALDDRLEAEQIVAGLCRLQAALVTTATRSAMLNQREAARAELERLVRRAALDALPPVLSEKPAGQASRKATAPAARKVAAPAAPRSPAATPAAKSAPKSAPLADRAPEPLAAAPGTQPPSHYVGRRPANRPGGLGDLPATADLHDPDLQGDPAGTARGTATPHRAERPARGRRLGLAVAAVMVTLGGLGLFHLTSQPDDQAAPAQLAGLPDLDPAPPVSSAPVALPELPVAEAVAPDALQLEAMEPTAGPLREQASLGRAAGGSAGPSSSAGEAPLALGYDNLSVVIHYQRGGPAAAIANGLSSSLALSKDPVEVQLRPVDFIVATPRIRYFYAGDAEAAAALAAFLDPPTRGGSGWQIQDFTHFRPGPAEGTLELFVPSTSG